MAAPQGQSWLTGLEHILENPTAWGIKQGANLGKDLHVPGAGIVSGAANTVTDTGHFMGALLNPNTWVRVGEVVVGLILVAVGVDHMMGTNFTGKAAKAAGTAALL